MTLAEASRAAGTPITTGTTACNPTGIATADAIWPPAAGAPFVQFGVQDGRIVTIHVFDPQVETLSGIHIGSTDADVLNTYPNAVVGQGVQLNRALRITSSDSRVIVFYEDTYDTPGTVRVIELAINSAAENVGSC